MDDLHTSPSSPSASSPTLILRSWSAEDTQGAFEIYGDPRTAKTIGRRQPVRDLAEMRELLRDWDLQSSQSPVPQGLWAVEAAPASRRRDPASLQSARSPACDGVASAARSEARGHGVAGQIGHALAHQAFLAGDVDEVFVATSVQNVSSLAVAKRLGMTVVDDFDWAHRGVQLEVLRMRRADLHKIRPGISLDYSYDPDGLDDW